MIPGTPFSKIGDAIIIPSASNILSNSHKKSSLIAQTRPLPLINAFTQAMHPVQCLISSLCKLINSISAPASCAPINASLHIESLEPLSVPDEIPKIFIFFPPLNIYLNFPTFTNFFGIRIVPSCITIAFSSHTLIHFPQFSQRSGSII